MNNKYKMVGIISLLVAVFALGRYSVSFNKSKQTTESITQDKKDTVSSTTTVIVKEVDGKETTTIKTDKRIKERDSTNIKSEVVKVEAVKGKLNVSLLGGYDFSDKSTVYGLSINKEFIYNFTYGFYGLNNGILGVTVGVNF